MLLEIINTRGGIMGRPYMYKSVADMQAVIDQYFKDCEGELLRDNKGDIVYDKFGKPVILNQRPPTITGLALALGFAGRQTLLNYQGRKCFKDTITRAKARIEAYAEERLFDRDGVKGAMFSLVNNCKGWSYNPTTDDNEANEPMTKLIEGFKDAEQQE